MSIVRPFLIATLTTMLLQCCYVGLLFVASSIYGFVPSYFPSTQQQTQYSITKICETMTDVDDKCLDRRQMLVRSMSLSTAIFSPKVAIASTGKNETIIHDSRRHNTISAEVVPKMVSAPSSLDESLSGFIAGALLAATKTVVKYPLDTVTVRAQMPNSAYSIRDPGGLFDGCYNGISLTLLSNVPAGSVFFAVKDSVKAIINNSGSATSTMPSWLSTSLAVAIAQGPYWLVRNPSEVIKVRQQADIDGYGEGVSAIDAVRLTLKTKKRNRSSTADDYDYDSDTSNISELYTGYLENMLYAYPADVIKFVAYESLTKGRKDLSPFEGARAGAISTAIAQLVTTPLDVVRNRLMTGEKGGERSSLSLEEKQANKGYVGSLVALGKEEGLNGLFAGSIPRVGKAFLSGAIQFATYEESKQSVLKFLLQRSK